MPFMLERKEIMNETRTPELASWTRFIIAGGLSTYLRPMGTTVPAMPGPSADELVVEMTPRPRRAGC